MGPLRPSYDGTPGVMHPSREILAMCNVHEFTREAQRGPREDLLSTYVESPQRISLVYIRGLLQRTELFRSVRGPNQDPILSRGPLSELRPLIKSKWASLDAVGPLKPPYDGAPGVLHASRKILAICVRRIPKAIDRLLQATRWGLSTDGQPPHIDGGPLKPHRRPINYGKLLKTDQGPLSSSEDFGIR